VYLAVPLGGQARVGGPVHEAPRGQDLLIGIALLVIGGLLASNFRGFRGLAAWNARRAIESATWAEWLLGRVPPWKSLPRQALEDRTRMQVIATVIGLALAAAGVVFLLAAFGVGHVYTNCGPPYANCR
jgi:integral membrane sensor domain MASE1